jgi:hypothetical protein
MSRRPLGSRNPNVLVQNILRLAALEEIRGVLASRGIPILYIKGAAFLDTLYPDLSERSMCDVDVLVGPKHQPAAAEVLSSMGFRRSGPVNRPVTYDEHYEWVFLRDHPSPITFELHRGFCQDQRHSIDYDGIWARHVVYERGGRIIPTLCPEDCLLHVALHEAMHSFIIDGRSAEDIQRIVSIWKPNWDTVVARAKQWQMTFALYVSLHASIRQRATQVPDDVMAALRPGKVRHALLERLVDMKHTGRSPQERLSRSTQLMTLLLTIEEPANLIRFGAYYGQLRARDWFQRISGAP